MYQSKHYTCEEIDERLLKGYYDDAVSKGYSDTFEQFKTELASIKDIAKNKESIQSNASAINTNANAITHEIARAKAAEQANAQAIAEEKVAIIGTDRISDSAVTTDKLSNGAVTSEKISTSAFDSTLSVSGKIAPADVVGGKLSKLEGEVRLLFDIKKGKNSKKVPIVLKADNKYRFTVLTDVIDNAHCMVYYNTGEKKWIERGNGLRCFDFLCDKDVNAFTYQFFEAVSEDTVVEVSVANLSKNSLYTNSQNIESLFEQTIIYRMAADGGTYDNFSLRKGVVLNCTNGNVQTASMSKNDGTRLFFTFPFVVPNNDYIKLNLYTPTSPVVQIEATIKGVLEETSVLTTENQELSDEQKRFARKNISAGSLNEQELHTEKLLKLEEDVFDINGENRLSFEIKKGDKNKKISYNLKAGNKYRFRILTDYEKVFRFYIKYTDGTDAFTNRSNGIGIIDFYCEKDAESINFVLYNTTADSDVNIDVNIANLSKNSVYTNKLNIESLQGGYSEVYRLVADGSSYYNFSLKKGAVIDCIGDVKPSTTTIDKADGNKTRVTFPFIVPSDDYVKLSTYKSGSPIVQIKISQSALSGEGNDKYVGGISISPLRKSVFAEDKYNYYVPFNFVEGVIIL